MPPRHTACAGCDDAHRGFSYRNQRRYRGEGMMRESRQAYRYHRHNPPTVEMDGLENRGPAPFPDGRGRMDILMIHRVGSRSGRWERAQEFLARLDSAETVNTAGEPREAQRNGMRNHLTGSLFSYCKMLGLQDPWMKAVRRMACWVAER